MTKYFRNFLCVFICGVLCACGGGDRREARAANQELPEEFSNERGSIFDLFENTDDPNVTLEVNRYIWQATLEVLNFLPIEAADPFSGVIDYGFGTPPGGGQAYAGTVLITDPALDARALTVALRTRSGPVTADVQRQIEDAILTRARQLRIQDSTL